MWVSCVGWIGADRSAGGCVWVSALAHPLFGYRSGRDHLVVSVPKAIEVTPPWDGALARMASCGILGELLGLCEPQLSLHLLRFFHGMIVKV